MSEFLFELSQNNQTYIYKMSEWPIPITALANASSLGISHRRIGHRIVSHLAV